MVPSAFKFYRRNLLVWTALFTLLFARASGTNLFVYKDETARQCPEEMDMAKRFTIEAHPAPEDDACTCFLKFENNCNIMSNGSLLLMVYDEASLEKNCFQDYCGQVKTVPKGCNSYPISSNGTLQFHADKTSFKVKSYTKIDTVNRNIGDLSAGEGQTLNLTFAWEWSSNLINDTNFNTKLKLQCTEDALANIEKSTASSGEVDDSSGDEEGTSGMLTGVIVAIVIGVIGAICIVVAIVIFARYKRRSSLKTVFPPPGADMSDPNYRDSTATGPMRSPTVSSGIYDRIRESKMVRNLSKRIMRADQKADNPTPGPRDEGHIVIYHDIDGDEGRQQPAGHHHTSPPLQHQQSQDPSVTYYEIPDSSDPNSADIRPVPAQVNTRQSRDPLVTQLSCHSIDEVDGYENPNLVRDDYEEPDGDFEPPTPSDYTGLNNTVHGQYVDLHIKKLNNTERSDQRKNVDTGYEIARVNDTGDGSLKGETTAAHGGNAENNVDQVARDKQQRTSTTNASGYEEPEIRPPPTISGDDGANDGRSNAVSGYETPEINTSGDPQQKPPLLARHSTESAFELVDNEAYESDDSSSESGHVLTNTNKQAGDILVNGTHAQDGGAPLCEDTRNDNKDSTFIQTDNQLDIPVYAAVNKKKERVEDDEGLLVKENSIYVKQ